MLWTWPGQPLSGGSKVHPEIARQLIAQRQRELQDMARSYRAIPRPRRRWRLAWSVVASPVGGAGSRTVMIIISARRTG